MTNERLMNQEANFILDALCDRQPVQHESHDHEVPDQPRAVLPH